MYHSAILGIDVKNTKKWMQESELIWLRTKE